MRRHSAVEKGLFYRQQNQDHKQNVLTKPAVQRAISSLIQRSCGTWGLRKCGFRLSKEETPNRLTQCHRRLRIFLLHQLVRKHARKQSLANAETESDDLPALAAPQSKPWRSAISPGTTTTHGVGARGIRARALVAREARQSAANVAPSARRETHGPSGNDIPQRRTDQNGDVCMLHENGVDVLDPTVQATELMANIGRPSGVSDIGSAAGGDRNATTKHA